MTEVATISTSDSLGTLGHGMQLVGTSNSYTLEPPLAVATSWCLAGLLSVLIYMATTRSSHTGKWIHELELYVQGIHNLEVMLLYTKRHDIARIKGIIPRTKTTLFLPETKTSK